MEFNVSSVTQTQRDSAHADNQVVAIRSTLHLHCTSLILFAMKKFCKSLARITHLLPSYFDFEILELNFSSHWPSFVQKQRNSSKHADTSHSIFVHPVGLTKTYHKHGQQSSGITFFKLKIGTVQSRKKTTDRIPNDHSFPYKMVLFYI